MTINVKRRQLLTLAAGGAALSGVAKISGFHFLSSALAASESSPAVPRRGGSLVISWGGLEPQALYVPGGGGSAPFQTSTKILERLLKLDDKLAFQPVLAESVTPSADFKSYVVILRKNVSWHDGKPFTADDVVFNAIEHWKAISAGIALKALEKAEAIDTHTVKLTFSLPVPEFFLKSTLAGQYQLVLPKHLYQGQPILTNPLNNRPVGTGPWKYANWVRGSYVEYQRNDQYWNAGQPYLDKLIVRWWGDATSRTAALETGELQVGYSNPVPARDLDRLVKSGNITLDTRGYENSAWTVTVEFNQRREHVNRREVRQAILHAIDRDFIVNTIYYGRGKPAISPIFSGNPLFFTRDVPTYPFDTDKARQLLDQAGLTEKDGKRFTVNLLAAAWFEENARLGQYLKQALEEVGIAVNLDSVDRATALKRIYSDYNYDIAISNFTAPIEPVPTVTQFFASDGIVKGGAFRNATGYKSEDMDKLVAAITIETDEAKRKTLVHQFARLASTDVPIVPLIEMQSYTLAHNNVRNVTTDANVQGTALNDIWLAG
ncbi:twin-arginine translocation pathway signal protein [Erwinia sp. OLTSP20]|uniref:ABC transporter substrate-binding protein n=1 Tax=unclassified Erwinia TaxID=2622719 RepID=UPI000C186EB4|nr:MULTISPECIES: ABC transporter substrate-binding protein [unclassified Erwinia]PIJ51731.1 twin-arginine translocation pathway signal protein [Erwinia sp. OAMSP11]PIJ75618.1 twin-arginine translocation pathway signal protein [Erwinia sp. OLSSP12]PIJ84923.1 twin-arginine translocation pathway signal protein [Erwinia sp. OLCASP19]PIJ86702.1 twin-arginine translocation pathway signal protein [Erwinia sp. OLMTSP26]PIJ88143.1 twin-arginine translocation pathway signal protein [Erwinia sp. OLMDSP33